MFETWYQCEHFLLDHKLDLTPLISHQIGHQDYEEAFALLKRGEAVKIVMSWE
jgi:threonine 3-dehydrogenase